GAPVTGVKLSIAAPRGWTVSAHGSFNIPATVAPDASVSATFNVTSGPAAFNGDLLGKVSWTNANGRAQAETAVEKVRNTAPVKINEFRVGAPGNATDSFIELYNAGPASVDLSNWSLTEHPTQEAIFSAVKIPAGTKLASHGFYLLGLANSGLAAPARKGDSVIHVRGAEGMSAGDSISIDGETRKIAAIGTAAANNTTLWQPLPDGPVIAIPAGATNVPVTSTAGFKAGEKMAIGYGASYPAVGRTTEHYEVVTVTAVGKAGTQALLAADAPAGSKNIKVTSVANISAGDRIRLDIESVGHGVETVTVARVGTAAVRSALVEDASAGATSIRIRGAGGPGRGAASGPPFAAGEKVTIGTPATRETVTVTAIKRDGNSGGPFGGGFEMEFTPALAHAHIVREGVVAPGTGLDLAAPLRFSHADNLPFSARGTGITFTPAAAFAHSSNEPVQPLGEGIRLDSPLASDHGVNAVVRDTAVKNAGYQGAPQPNQWFGGPALSPAAGSMVLRDAAGLVADSLNYGLLVDPWAGEGYQGVSGTGESGCRVISPGAPGGFRPFGPVVPEINRSAGRYPDGADTDSNCADFVTPPATTLSSNSANGATNIKVASVAGFEAGQPIALDEGANSESAVIATVGTAGATTLETAAGAGATVIPVAAALGFANGQTVTIDEGANRETAVIVTANRRGAASLTLAAPLAHAHPAGAQVSGTGITLTTSLTHPHASGAKVDSNAPTPGAPNRYYRARR
ncbi:MAG: lamin tail domain-containing protein, partial [Acidobacteriota bacterium]|nr:lamin tail domain-containing protein [Acidobacteriota bacterium]